MKYTISENKTIKQALEMLDDVKERTFHVIETNEKIMVGRNKNVTK